MTTRHRFDFSMAERHKANTFACDNLCLQLFLPRKAGKQQHSFMITYKAPGTCARHGQEQLENVTT